MDYFEIFSSVSFDIRCTNWSCEDNKMFEECLTIDCIGDMDEFDRINQLYQIFSGRKTLEEIKIHYKRLVGDINKIESGLILFPDEWYDDNNTHIASTKINTSTKGQQWTPDEHRLFLIGLKLFDKSYWREISRLVVISRSPSQVASHAQKYYDYLKAERAKAETAEGVVKVKKRFSIHDINTIDVNDVQALDHKGLFEDDKIKQEILQKLASEQQCTPNSSSNSSNSLGVVLDSVPMIASGRVQRSPYTPDSLGVVGVQQQPTFALDALGVVDASGITSGSVQQPLYASGSVQQQAPYAPDSLGHGLVYNSGSVQQPPYTHDYDDDDCLRVDASSRFQQQFYTPNTLEALAFGRVQPQAYYTLPEALAFDRVHQQAYTPGALASSSVQQQGYTPEAFEPGWFQ